MRCARCLLERRHRSRRVQPKQRCPAPRPARQTAPPLRFFVAALPPRTHAVPHRRFALSKERPRRQRQRDGRKRVAKQSTQARSLHRPRMLACTAQVAPHRHLPHSCLTTGTPRTPHRPHAHTVSVNLQSTMVTARRATMHTVARSARFDPVIACQPILDTAAKVTQSRHRSTCFVKNLASTRRRWTVIHASSFCFRHRHNDATACAARGVYCAFDRRATFRHVTVVHRRRLAPTPESAAVRFADRPST